MKTEILKNLINRLIEVDPNKSPLISCFINLESPRTDYFSEIEAEARFLAKRLSGQRLTDYEDALDEIREYVKKSVKAGSKGVAIYARWGQAPVFVPIQFEVPLKSAFIVDDLPHVYPLIELKDTYHRFVTVVTTETKARILETTIGSVTEEIMAERPELRERIGREWTREHYSNHKNEREQQFVREKIRIIEELMNRAGHNHLVIAGSPKMASRLTNALPPRLQEKLISTVSLNPKAGISPILAEAIQLFAAAENVESHDHVSKLERAFLSGGLGVIGYEACRDALAGGYADMLIIDQAFCDLEMREELVRLAAASSARIETVNSSETLQQLTGVGCLLRYQPNTFVGTGFNLAA